MSHLRRSAAFLSFFGLSTGVGAVVAAPPKPALQPFELTQVKLGDGILSREMQADRQYLHDLDANRLLYNFRKNAGLDAPGQPLGGWEAPDCEVRGHFVGHYLSACALMYRSAGDTDLKTKADAMVTELAKCQDAMKGGYLAAFPESFFDRVEQRKPVWAPYYTVHKMMAGLVDMYTYCGNKQALQVAEGMADYFKRRTDKLSDDQFNNMLGNEFGGMANVLYDLYAINHRPGDLALAHRFDQQSFLHPLTEDMDDLSHIHANTHIPKVLGAARRYELLGDEPYGHLTSFFWDRVANHRSYATGGSSADEGWGPPDQLAHTLMKGWRTNQETCTTYNMLKVTRDLIRWTADPQFADYYEKAYWNGIVEAQNPANGMIIYYTTLGAGGTKTWSKPNDTFWCCSGTGVESFAKLNDSIYFHDDDGLYVNLYAASTVDWSEKRTKIEQITKFPEEQGSTIAVNPERPTRLVVHLHIPLWAGFGCKITVNGEPAAFNTASDGKPGKFIAYGKGISRPPIIGTGPQPGTYAVIDRTWKKGDRIHIDLPMHLHMQPMPDDPDVQAVMYGPLTLAGLVDNTSPQPPYDKMTGLVKVASADPATWLKPVPDQPLTFRTVGQAKETTFVPLYYVIDQMYTVYWTVDAPGSKVAARTADFEQAEQARLARFVDIVQPNDPDSEKAHGLVSDRSGSGEAQGHGWRDANGGYFQWDLKAKPNMATKLLVSYWGADQGRTFDILVNGQKIATEELKGGKPAETYDIEYPLPAALVGDKSSISVRFQAHEGSIAGGVFGCAVER